MRNAFLFQLILATFAFLVLTSESHVAVCLSGEIRTFDNRDVQVSFKTHVLDVLARKGHTVHTFLVANKAPSVLHGIELAASYFGPLPNSTEPAPPKNKVGSCRQPHAKFSGPRWRRFHCYHLMRAHIDKKKSRSFHWQERHELRNYEFILHTRPDVFWFHELSALEMFKSDTVYLNANHFPVGDVVNLIPGKLMDQFYTGLHQMEWPGCCYCEGKPLCYHESEPTFLALFAVLRIAHFESFPFPAVIYRWFGAECFRWTSLLYFQAVYFNDSNPHDACLREVPRVKPSPPGHQTENINSDTERIMGMREKLSALFTGMLQEECVSTKPGYQSSALRDAVTLPEIKDFRSITAGWNSNLSSSSPLTT